MVYNGENKLNPKDKHIAEARDLVLNYLVASSYDGDVNRKIDEIVESCVYGWNRAPRDFMDRIKLKIGRNSVVYKSLEKNKENDGVIPKGLTDFSGYDLASHEQKFLKEREFVYRKDYDFNDSSDLPLLTEILLLELTLRRLQAKRLKEGKSIETDKRVSFVQNQLMDNMDKLGILRSQRIDQDSNIEGNVSQISVIVEKKLDEIKDLKDEKKKQKVISNLNEQFAGIDEEELEMIVKQLMLQREHDMQPPSNIIPDAEMAKILKEIESV